MNQGIIQFQSTRRAPNVKGDRRRGITPHGHRRRFRGCGVSPCVCPLCHTPLDVGTRPSWTGDPWSRVRGSVGPSDPVTVTASRDPQGPEGERRRQDMRQRVHARPSISRAGSSIRSTEIWAMRTPRTRCLSTSPGAPHEIEGVAGDEVAGVASSPRRLTRRPPRSPVSVPGGWGRRLA